MKLIDDMIREFRKGGMEGGCGNMRRLAGRVSCFRIREYARYVESYAGLSFDDIVCLHNDDSTLRAKMMFATGLVEMFMRMKWSHFIEENFGEFGHRKKKLYREGTVCIKGKEMTRHEVLINAMKDTKSLNMPVQQLAEGLTFGLLSKFIGNLHGGMVKEIGRDFDRIGGRLPSMLHNITMIRNKCAHFSRMWNIRYPALGKLQPCNVLAEGLAEDGDAPGAYNSLVLLACMTDIIQPEIGWKTNMLEFIENSAFANRIEYMGFPKDWRKREVWKA